MGHAQMTKTSEPIRTLAPDVAKKYLDAILKFRATLIELSEISPNDLTHLPEYQRRIPTDSWARQQWIAALVTVSKLVIELDVPANTHSMIDSLLARLQDLQINGTVAPEFKSSRGNSGRLPDNERHARAYLAAAVWCMTQTGQKQEEAAKVVAKLLHNPDKLNRHQGREKQSPPWKRVLRIFEEMSQRDKQPSNDANVDLDLVLYQSSCDRAAAISGRRPQAERNNSFYECARGLVAVAEHQLGSSSLPI